MSRYRHDLTNRLQELTTLDRLRAILVVARGERFVAILRTRISADGNGWNSDVEAPDLANQLISVDVRHREVRDDEMRSRVFHGLQCRVRRFALHDVCAAALEERSQQFP